MLTLWFLWFSVSTLVMRWDRQQIDTWTASSRTSHSDNSPFTCTQHTQTQLTHTECVCSSCCVLLGLCNYPLATARLQKSPVIAAQCRCLVPVSEKSIFPSFIYSLLSLYHFVVERIFLFIFYPNSFVVISRPLVKFTFTLQCSDFVYAVLKCR